MGSCEENYSQENIDHTTVPQSSLWNKCNGCSVWPALRHKGTASQMAVYADIICLRTVEP